MCQVPHVLVPKVIQDAMKDVYKAYYTAIWDKRKHEWQLSTKLPPEQEPSW